MGTLESTTTGTANTMATRAMATTRMTMTVVTMTIMMTTMATMTITRMIMVTKTTMDMVMKDMTTTITGTRIPMVLGANTDGTGVTVTTTDLTTDLVEATSHSSVSTNSSILWASKELLTPPRIQSTPTKDLWITPHRIQSLPIKYPGMLRFPNSLCNLDNRCYLLILQSTNPISQPKYNQYHSPSSLLRLLRMPQK